MFKWFTSFWQVRAIKQAIQQGSSARAKFLISARKQKGYTLTLLEKLFLENHTLKSNSSSKLTSPSKTGLLNQNSQLKAEIINEIAQNFRLCNCDAYKIQSTGIDKQRFDQLEQCLCQFLQQEISHSNLTQAEIMAEIQRAYQDLLSLKRGQDPNYNLRFSPHVYLMQYFLENIYCSYLSYFLIYQLDQLPTDLRILDIAAGPGTMLFGLALFLQTLGQQADVSSFSSVYYSLEQQKQLQYRGLQFWRYYWEQLDLPINIFSHFHTCSIFDYAHYCHKLPRNFFNLIVISHCFFYDEENRDKSLHIYRSIFNQCLQASGRVLLVIQINKFYRIFDAHPEEDPDREYDLVQQFVHQLGLRLIFYKYITSTGNRVPSRHNFREFAEQYLSPQEIMGVLHRRYLNRSYIQNYAIDDFVIYAEH